MRLLLLQGLTPLCLPRLLPPALLDPCLPLRLRTLLLLPVAQLLRQSLGVCG